MDQVKEILAQMIKYRFWIAVGIGSLLPIAAYFSVAGTIQKEAEEQKAAIKSAKEGVAKFRSGRVINHEYKPIVIDRKAQLKAEVEAVWRKLYERQVPLLRWPELVHEQFSSWGRQWPDEEIASEAEVQLAINTYTENYRKFVDQEVYPRFNPFNYETGEGVVSAPPVEQLIQPVNFNPSTPPKLPEVWAAQEKLWIQSVLLDVVAEVNKGAKTWDEAALKQINQLNVANASAQDQISLAQGIELVQIEFKNPKEDEVEQETTGGIMGDRGMSMSGGADMESMMESMAAMGGGRPGMMSGMGPGGSTTPDKIYYVDSQTEMFQIVPVYMSVLIKQDKVVDFLCALRNSPMTIRVMEFEQSKPRARVVKPEKNQQINFGNYFGYAGSGGMMSGMSSMMGMMGMMGGPGMGMGGDMESYMEMMGAMGGGRPGMMSGMMPGMGMGGMMMGGMGNQGTAVSKGTDIRSIDQKKERQKREEEAKKKTTISVFDPYYDIVQVSVYGQARFYNKPPDPSAQSAASTAATTATDDQADQ